ncbi:hypothetical protein T8T21_17295 (plasmid) [Limimaricola variabilis]|jgi:hypothetical protein|nr:hypothetical protein [Limimaricola variabilis]WPY96508.1 hypothetical protein T8T21_17295 [Limimaricola variabilis]
MGQEVAVRDRPDVLPSIAIDSDFDCKRIAIDMDEKQAFAALDLLDHLA